MICFLKETEIKQPKFYIIAAYIVVFNPNISKIKRRAKTLLSIYVN